MEKMIEEQDQVDYVPDSAKEKPNEKLPEITCKKCIHKDVCYFLTKLYDDAQCFKQSGVCELPFEPHILAIKCKKYELKNGRMPNTEKESGIERRDEGKQ